MMNNQELINKCSAILDRCLDGLPSYVRYDRKRKAEELINLAKDVYDKSRNQSIGSSSVGTLGIAGVSVGAMFGPLGMLAGGIGGALLGKAVHDISSMFDTDNRSYGIYNVGKKIDRHDWGYLLSDPNLTLRFIKDQIIDTLYPKRLNRLDMEMLMTLAEIPIGSMIETINCDLGIVAEIERYSGHHCITENLTELEKEISTLGHLPSKNQREVASLKILMAENIRYENKWTEPHINSLKDMRGLCILVEQLRPEEHFIAIAPKHMLYNPGFHKIRKALFINGLLKTIMDLKQPMKNGMQTELCALIFSGKQTDNILLLSNTWDHSLNFPLGKQDHRQHRKLLHNAVIKALSHPDKADGWTTVSYRSIGMPYVVTPTYRSKKKQGKSKMVELRQVASPAQLCRLRYSSVTGCIVSNEHLTKETPLKPIDKKLNFRRSARISRRGAKKQSINIL